MIKISFFDLLLIYHLFVSFSHHRPRLCIRRISHKTVIFMDGNNKWCLWFLVIPYFHCPLHQTVCTIICNIVQPKCNWITYLAFMNFRLYLTPKFAFFSSSSFVFLFPSSSKFWFFLSSFFRWKRFVLYTANSFVSTSDNSDREQKEPSSCKLPIVLLLSLTL